MGKAQIETLVQEPLPLLKERRGGAANVILAALIVEAARMVDENFDIPTIEAAGRLAFTAEKGFLALADEIGIHAISSFLFYLDDSSDPDDPFYRVYNNFFSPPESCRVILEKYDTEEDKASIGWVSPEDLGKPAQDFLALSLLKKRFQAVAYMTGSEIVEAGIVKLQDLDVLCKKAFAWEEGPLAQMNKIGIREAMQMVTEKMELSHRKEINFPIPKLLIGQAQKTSPGPSIPPPTLESEQRLNRDLKRPNIGTQHGKASKRNVLVSTR